MAKDGGLKEDLKNKKFSKGGKILPYEEQNLQEFFKMPLTRVVNMQKAISDRSGMAFPIEKWSRNGNGLLFINQSMRVNNHKQKKTYSADPIALANARSQRFQQPSQAFYK